MAEVTAIDKAIEYVMSHLNNDEVRIIPYLISALQSIVNINEDRRVFCERTKHKTMQNKIKIFWTTHVGKPGSERANETAKSILDCINRDYCMNNKVLSKYLYGKFTEKVGNTMV